MDTLETAASAVVDSVDVPAETVTATETTTTTTTSTSTMTDAAEDEAAAELLQEKESLIETLTQRVEELEAITATAIGTATVTEPTDDSTDPTAETTDSSTELEAVAASLDPNTPSTPAVETSEMATMTEPIEIIEPSDAASPSDSPRASGDETVAEPTDPESADPVILPDQFEAREAELLAEVEEAKAATAAVEAPLRAEMMKMATRLVTMEKDAAELQKKLSEAEALYASAAAAASNPPKRGQDNAETEKMVKQLQTQEMELEDTKRQLRAANADVARLKKSLAMSAGDAALQSRVDSLEQALENEQGESAAYANDASNAKFMLEQVTSNFTQLQADHGSLAKAKESLQKQLATLHRDSNKGQAQAKQKVSSSLSPSS